MGRVLGERVCLSVFLMPSLLNTVGKIICYDFTTKKRMDSRVSKVFIKRCIWLKLEAKDVLWYNFILGLNLFLFFQTHYHTPKQKKIKLKPRIKLNHKQLAKRKSEASVYAD